MFFFISVNSSIQPLIDSFTPSSMHSFPIVHSLAPYLIHPRTHARTHSLTHPRSFIQPLSNHERDRNVDLKIKGHDVWVVAEFQFDQIFPIIKWSILILSRHLKIKQGNEIIDCYI